LLSFLKETYWSLAVQLNASIFSNPAMRPQLEQYYEHQKAEARAIFEARDREGYQDIELSLPDGQTATFTPLRLTADALVSFDEWMNIQQTIHASSERHLEMAQKNLERLAAHDPDTSSNVRTVVTSGDNILGYVNADGTMVTHSNGECLQVIANKANDLGLQGQKRIDYMTREINRSLSQMKGDFNIIQYDESNSPTKREFAAAWYPNFDVDQHYLDAMAEARASYNSALEWSSQRQANLDKMQAFFLTMQEADQS
jgi:hypothetical protein